MNKHHRAWLDAHPEKDSLWLMEKTGEGFDVHHIDGDPKNNDPANLVLIEHTDHMMIHGGSRFRLRKFKAGPKKRFQHRVDLRIREDEYQALQDWCEENEIERSSAIRLAIKQMVENAEKAE